MSFCGAADIPVLDFLWHLPWILKPGWISCLHTLLPVQFLGFNSGATPVILLIVSMVAGHVPNMCSAEVKCKGWTEALQHSK